MSAHGDPVRKRHKIPLMTRRSSTRGTPRVLVAVFDFKLALIEKDFSKAVENRGLVEDSKLFLKWFDVEHEAAHKSLGQANSSVQNADYVGADKFLAEAEGHQANMQQFVLRKILNPDLDDEMKLKDPEQKLLLKI